MERINDLIEGLKKLKKTLRKKESVDTVERVMYELENGFNPADGVWLVKNFGRSCTKFAELSEVETLDAKLLAQLEHRRIEAIHVMRRTIEATREDSAGGTWWTVDGGKIMDAVFRAIIEDDKGERKF